MKNEKVILEKGAFRILEVEDPMKLTNKEKLNLVLKDLEQWINNGESDDSMVYAFRNGYFLHAANCWLSTGATSDDVLKQVEGLTISRTKELKEIKELLSHAYIYICAHCNHHGFYDDEQDYTVTCQNCLKDMPKHKKKGA